VYEYVYVYVCKRTRAHTHAHTRSTAATDCTWGVHSFRCHLHTEKKKRKIQVLEKYNYWKTTGYFYTSNIKMHTYQKYQFLTDWRGDDNTTYVCVHTPSSHCALYPPPPNRGAFKTAIYLFIYLSFLLKLRYLKLPQAASVQIHVDESHVLYSFLRHH
jgi:hypothetical protein